MGRLHLPPRTRAIGHLLREILPAILVAHVHLEIHLFPSRTLPPVCVCVLAGERRRRCVFVYTTWRHREDCSPPDHRKLLRQTRDALLGSSRPRCAQAVSQLACPAVHPLRYAVKPTASNVARSPPPPLRCRSGAAYARFGAGCALVARVSPAP